MRCLGKLGLCLSLTIVLAGHAAAGNWPRFRGPNGTGIADEKDIPVRWTETNGLLWKTPLPGTGNSSPIVWGDRLYLQAASPNGKERMLLCLSTTDGKVVWSRSVPGDPAHTNPRNSLASSTAATDGERVYVPFWDGKQVGLYAYTMDGEFVWRRPLGGFKSQHGPGASPIVCEDKVVLANDQDGASLLVCLDAKTGNVAWETPRKPFRACYSPPLLLEKPGQVPELIVTSTAGITSYNPRTGGENWHWTWVFSGKPLRTVSQPIVSRGVLFANSGDGDGSRHTVAIRPSAEFAKAPPVWEVKRTFPYVPGMLAHGDYLYWTNDQGLAACIDPKTGKTVWDQRLVPGSITASPVLIDGKVYAVDENGTVHVFAAEPIYKLLGKSSIGERVIASPAVADGRLFIRGQEHLFCIGKPAARSE